MKLRILVGTVGGTAEGVAQAIEMDCGDLVNSIRVEMMDGLDIDDLDANSLFLICTSTYGSGDVPDNARNFFDSLAIKPRFLGDVRYGVLALGDSASHGETFCLGGKAIDERLQDLGAKRIGEVFCLDAGDDALPESAGTAWCRSWLAEAARSWG